MRYRFCNIAAVTIVLAAIAGTAQANSLVTNGSFENTTNFVGNGDDTMVVNAGDSTTMPGWAVVGGSLAWIGPTNDFGLTAQNGGYFLDLTGYRDAVPYAGVTQSITTVSSDRYLLSFYLGSSSIYGTPDAITASAGSASHTFTSTLTGTNNWELETLAFTATGSSTLISLIGYSGEKYIGLDNVSVAQTPLPSTWTMLIAGFVGLGFFAYRGTKKNAASLAAT